MIKFILTLLFPLYTLALTGTDQALLGIGNINYLVNPGFESGRGGWTASGGTFSSTTLASNVQFGKGSVLWDSSAASQSLIATQSVALDSNNGLKGQSGLFSCYIKVPSGTATHLLQVFVGTTQYTQAITSSPTGFRTNLYFPITTASSQTLNNVGIVSVASNEPEIIIDDCFLGSASGAGSGIGQFSSISEPINAGTITIGATTTSPTKGTTSFDNVSYVKDGKYAIVKYIFQKTSGGTAGSGTYLYSLPSGLTIDTAWQQTTGSSTADNNARMVSRIGGGNFRTDSGPSGSLDTTCYAYNTTQFFCFGELVGSTTAGLVGSTFFDLSTQTSFEITVRVPIQGWSASQSAAAANQTDYGFTSFTPVSPQGLGTVTVASANDCGHWRSSEYLNVSCKLTIGTVAASTARLTLPNSLVISSTKVPNIRIAGHWWRSSATSNAVKRGSVLATGGNTYVEFSIDHYANAVNPLVAQLGNAILASSDLLSIEFQVPISGWEPNQRAPTLIGSVTSNSTGALRIETASITSSGVVTESSDWINGNCAVTGTSIYTCTLNSAIFSSSPVCTVTANSASGGISAQFTATPNTSSVVYYTYTTPSGGVSAQAAQLTCIGPR